MRNVFFIFVFLWLIAPFARADFEKERWEFRSEIRPSGASSEYVILELPSDFFSRLKPDLSDLRVVDRNGEVPYVAAVEREVEARNYVSARFFNLSSVPGQDTTFIADVGQEGIFHSTFTIETSSENFRRNVIVEGSSDQNSWRVLNDRGQIFDFTIRDPRYVTVSITDVSYPEATFRYLRIRILDHGDAPLHITGVKVSRQVSTRAQEVSYDPAMEISQNEKDRTTDVVLDIGAAGIPHRSARIAATNANFSRAVAIYESNDKKEWRSLGNAYIFSIDTPKFKGSNLVFNYPESTRRYLKFAIINRDDKPIEVKSVALFGVVRSILFRFDPVGEYAVYLGNPKARRPQYDIEKISQYVDAGSLDRVEAGPVEKNSSFVPIKPPLTERSPYLLPFFLGAVVLILAFFLLRLVVKTRSASQ